MSNNPELFFGAEGLDISESSPILESSSGPHQRHRYRRASSQGSADPLFDPVPAYESSIPSIGTYKPADSGFRNTEPNISSIGHVQDRNSLTPPLPADGFPRSTYSSPPGSSNPFLSPGWPHADPGDYTYENEETRSQEPQGTSRGFQDGAQPNSSSGLHPNYGHMSDPERRGSPESNTYDDTTKPYPGGCAPTGDLHSSRTSWLSISQVILSLYSTIFSGIWLALAIIQPRYGTRIHSGGSFTPTTASTIFALFAKTIELSFVTIFVTFLGQVLSRRFMMKASRGVNIAELSMRTWVIQPGFMFTHGQHLKHAGASVIGAITLLAAISAMLYTTASDALVSPHLKYGRLEYRVMTGMVKTAYANHAYIGKSCDTPISDLVDPEYAATTCLAFEHSGQAYHNSIIFLSNWTSIREAGGNGASSDIKLRPPAPAILYDNTTVTGNWISAEYSNMTSSYAKYNRIVNNVTMAMPHAGIFDAARLSSNGILQPEELAGVGEYSLSASVVSPSINVLCANMDADEIAPLIYTTWPNADIQKSTTGQKLAGSSYGYYDPTKGGKSFINSTIVDDIFEWGSTYNRMPPVFPMYPIDFNSLINISVINSDSVYLMIKSPNTTDYTVCQMRSFLSSSCSTTYNVSGTSGGHMEAHCDDSKNSMSYDKSVRDPPIERDLNWRDVASQFMLSLSLNGGIDNENSSTTRLLAQFIPTVPESGPVALNTTTPSIAETLAVMAGSTLLMSSQDASFSNSWDYSTLALDTPISQSFNASVASQQYTSGILQNWQGIFYVVLALVFVTNVFCMVYFFARSGLVTDFTEPPNLFALAVNSPPSKSLDGTCAAGPAKKQLNINWHVEQEYATGHFFFKDDGRPINGDEESFEMRRRESRHLRTASTFSKLSNRRTSRL